jgi:hypothetical protein
MLACLHGPPAGCASGSRRRACQVIQLALRIGQPRQQLTAAAVAAAAACRFLTASDHERAGMFKLIPNIEGSWLVQQSVGQTPVIMGRKLESSYYMTDRWADDDGQGQAVLG